MITADTLQDLTVNKLKMKLRSMGLHTGGKKDALVKHLLGLEPPPPKESCEKSKDKAFLARLFCDESQDGVRFMTPSAVHELFPFNRWPFDRFKPNFFNLCDAILSREAIAKCNIKDFEADLAAHPPGQFT